jgi:hypothetical protein
VQVKGTASTGALLVVLAIAAIGNLAWSGSAAAASRTGTVIGTAMPCIGGIVTFDRPRSFNVHVALFRDGKFVESRKVIDLLGSSNRTVEQRFTFKVPAGTYSVDSPADRRTVLVKPGVTTKVTLQNDCT